MKQNIPLLTIDDLRISFRSPSGIREVVHGVNLCIHQGEALALIGESGSGKSITAQAILQLLPVYDTITRGRILFKGEDLLAKTPQQMTSIRGQQIGMIFQDPMTSLNPTISVGKQIAEVLIRHKKLSYTLAKKHSIELLDLVRIDHPAERYNAYPFQLSGGMRQRILIAMAIACEPQLLIADEPTTALDVTIQTQILELLRELRKNIGMSLLFITHDLAVASSLCDRAAVMYQGIIVEEAPVDTLFSTPQHPYTKELLIPV
ncbi:MAG: ABC transporter ATP-binding protein [Parachlamydiaceae bacterium]